MKREACSHKYQPLTVSDSVGECRIYHKTVVVVNALSARVTEGVPITSDITNTLSHLSGVLPIQIICIRLGLVKASHCNLPLPRITQSEKYVSLFVPEDYQK